MKLPDELSVRSERVDKQCREQHSRGHVVGVFTDDPSRVAYCFVPKVGSTFWIRVFSFLHNFTGENVDSPWKISRLKVHNNVHSHGVNWQNVRGKARDYLKFLFVRHPFSRLWSAYLDKFFLPGFWQEVGVRAMWKVRGARSTEHARRCGNDLTFPEFVEFSLLAREPHWDPIYLRCDPCQFRPTVVGSMKTFERDSLLVLKRMGMEWVLKDVDHQNQNEKELTTLIEYNFNLVHSRQYFYKSCTNDTRLAGLLWRTFQMNGYIPKNSRYEASSSGPFSLEKFKTRVLETFRASLPLKEQLKKQKRDFLRNALSSLSSELMEWVKFKYRQDMLYFGFDEENY